MKSLSEILSDPTVSKEDKEITLECFAPLGYGARGHSAAVGASCAERNKAASNLAAEGREGRSAEREVMRLSAIRAKQIESITP
jgi:hypothetical protein